MTSVFLIAAWFPVVSLALSKLPSSAAFFRTSPTPHALKYHSPCNNCYGGTSRGRLTLYSKNEGGYDEDGDETVDSLPAGLIGVETRRQFFQQQIIATTALYPTVTQAAFTSTDTRADDNGYFSLRNQNNVPYAQRQKQELREQADRRRNAMSFSAKMNEGKWVPFRNVNRWDSVETCLLEMLPVRNPVFRRLQQLIQDLEVYGPTDMAGWKQTLLDTLTAQSFLLSKRSILEPVFNQDDPTELFIAKSYLGEQNVEALRSKLDDMISIATGDIEINLNDQQQQQSTARGRKKRGRKQDAMSIDEGYIYLDMEQAGDIDVDAFKAAKREALLALSEIGELLVPSFPYVVPNRGKFGNLPR